MPDEQAHAVHWQLCAWEGAKNHLLRAPHRGGLTAWSHTLEPGSLIECVWDTHVFGASYEGGLTAQPHG